MKNGFFAVLAIPLLFANIAMASNENTSSVPYTVVKVEEGEQYHFTKSVPDSSGNLTTEYYKINLDPSKFSTTGNLSWSKVYNDGPDTIAIKLPNNKIEYYKYTVVNPDRIYNTPSYNALTDQNDYIGINNTSFSINDKEVNSLNNDFISNTNPGPYGGFENRGHIENLSGAFIDNLIQYEFGYVHAGAAVFNSGTIDNLDGIFINNAAPHGAVALFSINSNHDPVIIRNIRGTFISNGTNKNADYTAYSGAIHLGYNSHVDKIEGNFINNSALAATILVDTDQTSVGEITGNFIGNTGPVEEPYPNGLYINGNNVIFNRTAHIGLINGSFVDNNAVSIYNNGEIQKISSEFINNKDSAIVNYYANIESIEKSNFVGNHGTYIGGAIYNHLNGNIGKISNCNFIGNSVKEKGGAIHNEKGTLNEIKADFFENVSKKTGGAISQNEGHIGNIEGMFVSNSAQTNGGAIYNIAGTHDKITGDFFKNTAGNNGGAIYNGDNEWEGTIENISGNFIENSANNYGGAIYNTNSKIGKISGNFTNNYARKAGGAIYNDNGEITEISSSFVNNESRSGSAIFNKNSKIGTVIADFTGNKGTSGSGGAIAMENSTIDELSGKFTDNQASASGGFISSTSNSKIGKISGEFINNTAVSNGGAIRNVDSSLDYVYGTFDSNVAKSGGAIYVSNSETKEIQSDFVGNKATNGAGGAIYSTNSNIDKISGRYQNNNASGSGGGISVKSNSNIKEIHGIFTENKAGASGAAILNENSAINNINGSFINNEAKFGGALAYTSGSTEKISGNFSKNKAHNETSTAYGGAIFVNSNSHINEIQGNFEENSVISKTDRAKGGAISVHDNGSTVDKINGNFVKNTVTGYDVSTGGAIHNMGSINNINGDFTDNTVTSVNSSAFGGAIYNESGTGALTVKGSFVNNGAISNTEAKGGAIYNTGEITLLADNSVSLIKDNYTLSNGTKDNNAIYTGADASTTLKQINNGQMYLYDNIRGDENYNVNITGDGTGTLNLYNDIYNANVTLGNTNINTINGAAHNYAFKTFTLNSNSNFGADVDLVNNRMDRISAESYGEHNGNLNVNNLNLLSYANSDKTSIKFADEGLAYNVTNSVKEINTPIFKYGVSYKIREDSENLGQNAGYFEFERSGGGSSNKADSYNPAVLTQPTASQTGVQTNIDTTFSYAFNNVDTYTLLPSFERFARMNENKYAFASTDFNSNINYSENNSEKSNAGIWVKPYTSFERIPLHNGPKVDAITYGTLIGYDSKFKHHRHGWHSVTTPYAGYNGGQIKYSGTDTSMNGGLLGLTESFYKGNFWTAISANVGAANAESSTMYGKEDSTSLFAAIASKTGYNFEFKDGKYIVQPNFMINYSFINTFDYKNAAGVKIDSQPLHTIQINPGVRFIANFENGWQPYLTAGMVWNLLNETHATANGYKLPSMHIKPYFEYGLGLQKLIADRHTGFIQAVVRNGGRNGVVLTLGFRTKIGAEPSSSKNKSSRTEIKK